MTPYQVMWENFLRLHRLLPFHCKKTLLTASAEGISAGSGKLRRGGELHIQQFKSNDAEVFEECNWSRQSDTKDFTIRMCSEHLMWVEDTSKMNDVMMPIGVEVLEGRFL